MGYTKMWRIKEMPEVEIEQTPGAWVIWFPCKDSSGRLHEFEDEECEYCGGTGSKVQEVCGLDEYGLPTDPGMIARITGLDKWTPEPINLSLGEMYKGEIDQAMKQLEENWNE